MSNQPSIAKTGIPPSRVINTSYLATLNDFYKCNICFNIMINPTDCENCGHSYCYECITSHNCPYGCEAKLLKPSSSGIRALLSNLVFKCENEGCDKEIAYSDVLLHDQACDYKTVECPHKNCKTQLPKKDLENHIKNDCPYTLVPCQYCGHEFMRMKLKEHEDICKAVSLSLNGDTSEINIGDTRTYLEALSLNVAKIVKEKRNDSGNNDEKVVQLVESVIAEKEKGSSDIVDKVDNIEKNINTLSTSVLDVKSFVTEEMKKMIHENVTIKEEMDKKINNVVSEQESGIEKKFKDIKESIDVIKNDNREKVVTVFPEFDFNEAFAKISELIGETKTMIKTNEENIIMNIKNEKKKEKEDDNKEENITFANVVKEIISEKEQKIIKETESKVNTLIKEEKEKIQKETNETNNIIKDEIHNNYISIQNEITSMQSNISEIKQLISSYQEKINEKNIIDNNDITKNNIFSIEKFSFETKAEIDSYHPITKNSIISFANDTIEQEKDQNNTIITKIENNMQNITTQITSEINAKFALLEKKIDEDFDNKLREMFRLKYCIECEKVDYYYAFIKCAHCNGENCKSCILLCSQCKRLICKNCTICPRCEKACDRENRVICTNCNTDKKYCVNCV